MASSVATQPMPASHLRLGSARKASLLKGFALALWPLLADVAEPPGTLSSSTLSSFDGDKLTLLLPSRLFSGAAGYELAVLVGLTEGGAGDEEDEERRNKFGAWLEELVSGTSG